MKKILVFLVAALALPTSVALAKPSHPARSGKSAPRVQYVLKGTLSAYTAADSARAPTAPSRSPSGTRTTTAVC